MIELNDEQKLAVEKAQKEFSELKADSSKLSDDHLNLLFGQARSTVSYTHLTLPTIFRV